MRLNDYVSRMKRDIERFREEYLKRREEEGAESYPLEMSPAEWAEEFQVIQADARP